MKKTALKILGLYQVSHITFEWFWEKIDCMLCSKTTNNMINKVASTKISVYWQYDNFLHFDNALLMTLWKTLMRVVLNDTAIQ